MVGVPRSQRLLAFKFTVAAASPQFVCPPNTVTLVKSAYFTNQGAVVASVYVAVRTPGALALTMPFRGDVPPVQSRQWEGWVVLNPGDSVNAASTVADVDVWISGAVLAGAPVYPPAERADPLVWPPESETLPFEPRAELSAAGLPDEGPPLTRTRRGRRGA